MAAVYPDGELTVEHEISANNWGKIPDMSKADLTGFTVTPVFLDDGDEWVTDAVTEYYEEIRLLEMNREMDRYEELDAMEFPEPVATHVTILFPDGEREIPIATDGKPRKTPGYVYEQTITGEWFAVRT